MASKGNLVYVLRTWDTDGYESWDDADTFHYSIVAKELS